MDDPIIQFTMSDLVHRTGTVADAADRQPVMITRHGRPRYVLVRAEDFARLNDRSRDPRRVILTEQTPDDLLEIFADDMAGAVGSED
jgi:prevent-host-death family protein